MDAGVRLLGPPAERVANAWVPLRPTKPHALLAYVACRGGRVRRAELAALMWPEADAEHAFGDVRQALRSLRQEPFGELIERDRGAVWLPVASDVAAFRRAVGERRQAVVGRDGAIAKLVERLVMGDARLVTLLGPGGIGKTTLAAAALGGLHGAFPDGVFVVPLEGQAGPDAVAVAAARAAGLRLRRQEAVLPQLTLALDGRRALLLLDGFETHLDQVMTVDALVRETVGPTVLVTSRRRLGLSTEVVVEVGPLATEGGPPSPAARRFRRAAAWPPPPAAARALDPAAVERITRLLGGHPLALELVAGSVGAPCGTLGQRRSRGRR